MDLYLILELVKRSLRDIPPTDFITMEISEKTETVYKRLKEKELIPQVSFKMKNDTIALESIKNMDSLNMPFVDRLSRYNHGILYAESDQVKSKILYERAKYFCKHRLFKEFKADLDCALTLDSLADNQGEIQQLKQQAFRLKKVYNRPYGKFYQEPPNIDEINPKIPNASSSIKIAIDNINGKHIVATKNIKAGEVLVVEDPFSAICETAQLLICDECFQRCYNLLPCDNCVYHLYCSDACKTTAWNTYHKYMCPLMKSFEKVCKVDSGVLLALKITIKNHAEYPNIDNYEDMDVDNEEYSSTSFRIVWNLARKLEDIQYEKQIFFSYLTVVLYEWLSTYTDFFENFQATINKKSFMKVLFTMMCVIDKSFPIRYITGVKFDHSQSERMGYGLYSVGSIFNHSCCPNVYHTFHGSTIVMRAIRSIKAGEQCYISYSYNYLYYMSNKNDRQQELTNCFQFECKCKACVNDWPTFQLRDEETWTKFRYSVAPNFIEGNVGAAKITLPRLLTILKRLESKEPNKDLVILQCLIRTCFQIFGNNNCGLNNN